MAGGRSTGALHVGQDPFACLHALLLHSSQSKWDAVRCRAAAERFCSVPHGPSTPHAVSLQEQEWARGAWLPARPWGQPGGRRLRHPPGGCCHAGAPLVGAAQGGALCWTAATSSRPSSPPLDVLAHKLLYLTSPGSCCPQARVTVLADSAGPAELAALVAEASGLGGCCARVAQGLGGGQ